MAISFIREMKSLSTQRKEEFEQMKVILDLMWGKKCLVRTHSGKFQSTLLSIEILFQVLDSCPREYLFLDIQKLISGGGGGAKSTI